jgi:hypothetical protein
MPLFSVVGTNTDLPAIPVFPKASTRDNDAWLHGQYVTVKLTPPLGFGVHRDGRYFKPQTGCCRGRSLGCARGRHRNIDRACIEPVLYQEPSCVSAKALYRVFA